MSYSYTDLNSSHGRLCRLWLAVFCLVAVCFSASAACVVRSNNGPDEIGDCVTDESMTFARSAVPTAGAASYGNWTDRYDMNHTIFAQTHSGKFSCGVIPCPMAGYSTDLYYPFIYTRYLSAPVTPSQVFRKTFNKEYHWVNVLKMNGNYVNLSDCSPDLLPYKGCTWAVGLFSTDVYDPASCGYLLTDNLKSIYPKAQGLAVDRGGAYMLLSGKNVQYNYRQGGYLGYCLPFRKFRTQRIKVSYKFYLVYVGDPANYKEYAEPQVVVHHRLVAHDTNNVVKPLEYTLSVHVVDNSTSRNIKNSTGDTVVSSYSMNDLGEYSFSAIRPLEKSFTSIVEFSTLRECGMTPAEENTVKDVYAILTATVQDPNYVIAIDTIRVQSAPRYVCASESSVKPGDIVHLTVHNDNSFLLHSFFRWEYSADKVNWKPDPLDAAGMKMLDDDTYNDKLEPQNLNSENVKELTSPTDVAALDLVIPKVTGDSLYIRAKYYPTFRGPAGCYKDFGKAANVIGNYFYLPPIVVNDPTKPKLTCNPLSAEQTELFTGKGTCSVSLASLLDFLPSDNRPSLSVTPTKVEYWYSKSGSVQGAEMRLADESTTFPAGSSYDLQTRLYYTDSEFHSCNQSFSVKDTTSPVIDCDTLKNIVADLTTKECWLAASAIPLPVPQSIDNCGAKIMGVLSSVPITYPIGDTILTWHFTDAAGNTTTCAQTVTVKDKFAPIVDCDTLKNVVADLTTNECRLSASAVLLSIPQSVDNCDSKIAGVLSPVPTTFPMGDTILTWHFTDAAGNTTTCHQTVIVKDKFVPVIDCDTLKNIVAKLTTNECRLSAQSVQLPTPQSIDNCDAKIAGVLSFVPTSYPVGDTILTWHFTDAAGNTTTCPQTVTVKDKFAPVVDCDTLKNIVADLTTNDCRQSAGAVPLFVPQSIDNCDAKISGVLSPVPTSYPMGDTILTWHFTDAAGNTTTCAQTVTVKDRFAPVIDCDTLKNIVAELTTNDCRLAASAVPLSVPQSIDNCGAKISGVLSPVPTSYSMGDTVLTWHFTDAVGNTTTCAQTVTVKDKFAPVIDCDTLKNIVADLTTNECRLSASAVSLSVPQSIDNCDAKISGVLSPVPISYPLGDTILTWHFADVAGNTTTCAQTVTIKDKFAPVIDCDTLKNIVAKLTTNECRLSANVVPLSIPQSVDNCDLKIAGVLSSVPTSYPIGDTILTWHFADVAGNTTTCPQTVTVKDKFAPIVDCDTLKNIVVDLVTNDCRLPSSAVSLSVPQSIDNCGAKIAGVLSSVPTTYPVGDTILTWHFTDAAGNTTTCPQTVTVKDKFAPVVDCDTLKNIVAKLTTNECRLSAQSVQLPTPQSIDNCGAKIAGVLFPTPTTYPMGDTILIWHFTDAAGNTTTCAQKVTVKDKFAPVIDCDTLKNIVAELTTNDCRLSANAVPLSIPQSVDNCDSKIAGVLSPVPTTYPIGDTILTWHFEDVAGNTTTCAQTVTVKDRFVPVIDCDTLKNIVADLTTNECRLSASAVLLSIPQSVDNCDSKIAGVLSPVPTTFPMGDTILTWHFADVAGNTTTCHQTIIVKDKFAPVIDCDTLKNIVAKLTTNECRLSAQSVQLPTPQSIDNCDAKIAGVLSFVPTSYPVGDTILTWHFTDAAGNTTTCPQTVTVKDEFAPVIDCDTLKNVVADLTTNDCRLPASAVPLSIPQSIDNCDLKIAGVLSFVPTTYPMGDTILIWHFTDAAGNTTTCPQTVTVKDEFAPVIDCDTLKNVVADLTTNDCRLPASAVPLSIPQSIDNCDLKIAGVLSFVPTSYPVGDTILTWHFTDAAGNTTTCAQTVTVKDRFAPVIDCDTLKNIVAKLTTNDCRLNANAVPLSVPQSIDNCGAKIAGVLSPVPTSYPMGDTVLTWHFTDALGNTTTCPQTVTVKDKFAPVVDCDTLKNIVAKLTTNECRLPASAIPLSIPQSIDNCDLKIAGVLSSVPTTYPIGDTILTWHFTDASGNITTCAQTVTVKDRFVPVIDCDTLKNIVADLTTNECRLSASAVLLSIPQSVDNCDSKIAGVLSPVPTTFPMGDTILTWHFADVAGNTTTCHQTVIVKDKFAPVIDCDTLKNIVAKLTTNECRLSAQSVQLPTPQSIDNCDAKIAGVLSFVPTSYPVGDTILTWHFTDAAGNTTTCPQTVTVKDEFAPVIDCDTLKNVVADLTTNDCRLPASAVPLSIPQSIDNCDLKIAGVLSFVPTSYPVGDTILTWHFTDAAGNTTTCAQTVTVKDRFAPVIDCDTLKNIVAKLTTNDCRLNANAVPLSVPQSIDNCGAKIAGVLSPVPTSYPMGDTVLTWHFTDALGNTTTCPQTVTVKDKFAPVVDCDTLKNIVAKLTTNECRLPASAIPLSIPQSIDNCDLKIAGVLSSVPTTYPIGDTILTWHFTDASGNITTCAQTVTVKDRFVPVIDCDTLKNIVADLTTNECRLSASAVLLSIPQSVDNCDSKIAGVLSPVPTTFPMGDTILTWHFTDVAGNTTTCPQTVTVKDKFAPVVDCDTLKNIVAELTTNECRLLASAVPLSIPQSIDNCDAKITGVLSPIPTTYPLGDTILTWHFTDASGNTTTCHQTVTVKDKLAPVIDCDTLKNIVAELTTNDCRLPSSAVPLSVPQSIDNRDAKISGVLSPDPTTYPMGDTVLIWHFTDVAGNTTTCAQTVTVKDKFAPVVDCDTLKNIVADLTTNECRLLAGAVPLSIPQSIDNCDAKIAGVLSSVPTTYPIGDTILTWHFTDVSGNTTTCHQTVTVKDKFAPVIDCDTLKNIVEELTTNDCRLSANAVSLSVPQSIDNCDAKISGVLSPVPNSYPLGDTILTWHFTDASGNTTTCPQTVTVKDKFSPVIDCDTLKNIVANLTTNECRLPSSAVPLSVPQSIDNCGAKITGVLSPIPTTYPMGDTILTWHFTDASGNTKTCPQTVTVKDEFAPVIDCDTLKKCIFYEQSSNKVPFDSLKMITPIALDNCGQLVNGVVKDTDSYKVGASQIVWHFVDSAGNQSVCNQFIAIVDTFSDSLRCPTLFPMVVNLSDSVCQLSAQQVHLSVPKIAVDGKSIVGFLTEPPLYFPMDTTVIYWHFVSEKGQTALCPQIVNVVDRHIPDFDCSALTGFVRYLGPENCTIAFDSLQLPISFAKDNCRTIAGIWHCEGNLDLPVGKTSLSLTFTDFNKNIKTCKSDVNVKDTIPPVWCPSCVDTVFVTSSTSPVLPVYGAMDNCSAVRISYTDSSTQSADPDDCSHHSYDLIRVFRATDAYGNVSVPRTCVCQVRDTAVPLLSMSAVPIEPVPIGHCQYLVPDLSRYISAHISDSSKLRVWQTPLAGDTLRQSCAVTFYAENRCGIRDSMVCPVLLPSRKQVVTIIAKSDTLCVDKSSPVSLVSTRLREAVGSSFLRNYDGQWMVVASTFVYDCYHDSVSANTLIYSNSPYTYGHLFQDAKGQPDIRLRNSLTTLNHACQSGRYVFVACDTTTRCTDTSAINLKLMERPRIVLAPDSLGEDTFRMSVCGVDTLAISHRLSQIDVCVDDMESEIIEEGWRHADLSLLGTLSPADSVPIVYYARNGCGVSTSVNSPYTVCDETALSGADSLRLAGNPHRLACWRIDSLYMNQSLMIEYHVPFSPSEVRLMADENVGQLKLCLMPDIQPSVVEWYRVSGIFDGNSGNRFDEKGRLHRVADMTDLDDERLLVDSSENGCILLFLPDTSASYYVVAGDGVCPAIPSELYNVDSQSLVIPTAITPYRHDGLNDIFMKGYPVMIFDQFGQKIFEGDDGWNGHNSVIGEMTVPGVYYYYLRLKDGSSRRGSIEVVKFIP